MQSKVEKSKDISAKRSRSGLFGRLKGPIVATAAGAFAVAVFAATVQEPQRPAQGVPSQPLVKRLAPVEVIRLEPADLSESLSLSGEVTPVRQVAISAEVAGLAGSVTHLPGETIVAGATLVAIAPEDYRLALRAQEATLARSEAQLRTAQSTFDRLSRLVERGAVASSALDEPQSKVDTLRADIAAAEAGVLLAKANLDRATVLAPIDGIIASRSVEPGQLVQVGDPLFEIIDLSTVEVEAMVPLAQAARIRTGQTALFWSPEDPRRQFEARVMRINPRAEKGTRSAIVYFRIDNSADALRGGMFLAGRIELRRIEGALALPRAAISTDEGMTSVLAIRDALAVRMPVTTGSEWNAGKLVQITDGLRSGDSIVALPLAGLEPGDRVEISEN